MKKKKSLMNKNELKFNHLFDDFYVFFMVKL